MSELIWVTKRDGRVELLDLEKVHRVLTWAAQGLEGVSVSDVELKAHLQFYQHITTSTIHETLTKSAADLISAQRPNYQYMASRLALFHLRKRAYGVFNPPPLYAHVKRVVSQGRYEAELLNWYSEAEFEALDAMIDHHRDLSFSYAGIKQLEGKYLVQDRTSKAVYETPQFLFILIAAVLFHTYPKNQRMDLIRAFYEATSLFKLSLPTPIMSGVRTPLRQFSSCVLIECDDSLNSINASAAAVVKYVSQRAGIGLNVGRIRALGSAVRGGEVFHTGCIPFFKYFQAAVKSCSQGGVRGGAATLFFPIWHLESESLLVLKNNRGVEDNRVRHLDYGVQLNRLFYQRLQKGQSISLFSPKEVPGLYDAFFEDTERFEQLYTQYEKDVSIRKKQVSAVDLFSLLLQERASTGRIYIQNVDHCNTHGAFDPKQAPIRQSNLCMEVALPTSPLSAEKENVEEIALCTLGGFNLGQISDLSELESLAMLLVRALDALLDYQTYPLEAASRSARFRRSLGIGVINFAYYLAKSGVKYSDGSAKALTHETFEAVQYYLLKASCELAKEKGPCPWFDQTRYSIGELPIDTYKKALDDVCTTPLKLDWEGLRQEIRTFGLRNSTLTAQMPSETSSQVSNATNGIEPPRGYVSIKASKDGNLKQVLPALTQGAYELLWDLPDNQGYLELMAIIQKFFDQSISTNLSYDPKRFPNQRVPMKALIRDVLLAYRLGIKTLYYHNTRDGMEDNLHAEVSSSALCQVGGIDCEGGACHL